MSLKVWLPLNGDLENKGISNLSNFSFNSFTQQSDGKIGKCYSGQGVYHIAEELLQNSWSLCAWVKASSWSTYNDIILCKNTSSSDDCQFYFSVIDGTTLNLGVNAGSSSASFSYTFATNTWYHVAATYNGSTYALYINGEQKKTGTIANALKTGMNNIGINCRSSNAAGTAQTGDSGKKLNDVRIYDNALSAAEVKEISQGLVLHYKLDGNDIPNTNLGKTSADYSNQTQNTPLNAGSWGGDIGTVTYYSSGGYAGLPYKHYHKTAAGTGGIYGKTGNDIEIESGITYTMSCWIKADVQFTASSYSFNINRGVGNRYITYGSNFTIYTDWHYYTKTFTATEDDAGLYGEMSIIYYDDVVDFNVYYSGFKIEKGTVATQWTPPDVTYTNIQDSSGYNHNGSILNTVSLSNDSPRYNISTNLVAGNSAINCGRGGMVTDSITVNLWLKSSAWANPISCTESGGWNFEASGDYFRFPIYISGVGYKYGQSTHTKAQICNNEWHMLTGIYDRLNQKVKIYVDGELDNEYAAGTSNIIGYNSTNVIWLGAEASSSATAIASNGMVGLFSDLRIYATPLLDSDIKSLYNIGMKIDNQQQVHTFEGFEQLSNIMYKPNLAIGAQEWKDGLNRYQQSNCQVSLTENGVHVYRPANLSQANDGNTMYGGLKIVNSAADTVHAYDSTIDNIFNLQKNHIYVWIFYVKGNTTNAPGFQVNNNMGWGGGGLTPSPSNVEIKNIPTNFDGETEVWYKFTISDDIVKTCTSSYSSFVANTQYLSYKHFGWNWSYATTGNGTDIYITNIRLYDITDIPIGKLTKTGITKFSSIFEVNDSIHITKNEDLIVNQFIER